MRSRHRTCSISTFRRRSRRSASTVIWRHGQEVGVAFAQATQVEPGAETGDAASSAGLAERVARLELEIAGLKRILKKMKTDAGPNFDVA